MPYPILTKTRQIEAFAASLETEKEIAVDLEADSMHSYQEKVCLLQFSTSSQTVLVDPLSGADLSSLKPIMAAEEIRKIFHAADYDIRCLRRDFSLEVRGLFDTMIAAQFLGEKKIGLADLLAKYFGVELDKQYQRADWSLRPLPVEMVRYAAEDTRYLHRLAALFEKELKEMDRISWAAEECSLLERVQFQEQNGPLFLKVKTAGGLEPRQLAMLEALLQWREGEAQRRDRPPFKIMGNSGLLGIARSQPHSIREMVGIEGISPRLAERYGKQLLKAAKEGMDLPENDLPVYPRGERRMRDREMENRLSLLKKRRSDVAENLNIDPGNLINNALLEEIARQMPHSPEQLATVPGLKRWQLDVLGRDLLKALDQ